MKDTMVILQEEIKIFEDCCIASNCNYTILNDKHDDTLALVEVEFKYAFQLFSLGRQFQLTKDYERRISI